MIEHIPIPISDDFIYTSTCHHPACGLQNLILLKQPLGCPFDPSSWSMPACLHKGQVVAHHFCLSNSTLPPLRGAMRPSAVTGAVFVAAVLLLVAVRDGHCAQLCMDSSMQFMKFHRVISSNRCLDLLLGVATDACDHGEQRSRGRLTCPSPSAATTAPPVATPPTTQTSRSSSPP